MDKENQKTYHPKRKEVKTSYGKSRMPSFMKNSRYFSHNGQVTRSRTMGRSPEQRPWTGYPIMNHG